MSRAARQRPPGPRAGLWIPVAVYAAAIFAASSISQPPQPAGVSDKSLHVVTYAGFAALLVRALACGWAKVTGRAAALGVILATLYGLTDEVHQLFVPGRTFDFRDLVADAAGAAAGVLIAWAIASRRRRSAG